MSYMDTKFCAVCDEDYNEAAPQCPGCVRRRYDDAQALVVAALKTQLAAAHRYVDALNAEVRTLRPLVARIAALEAVMAETLDLAEEGIGYTDDYFVKKWEMRERLAACRKALAGEPA
jgi:hypothetical protein